MTACSDRFPGQSLIPHRWVPVVVFFLGALLFLPSISSETSVTEKDEYHLSFCTPMEMLEQESWLTPVLDGAPRLRKPPLLYWAILPTYQLFGVHLWSARIWGVLAGAGLAVCACLFARELSSSDGLLAGLVTLGSVGVAVEARQAMLDLPLGLGASLAVYFWVRWLRHEKGRDLIFSALVLSLSFLIKGPVGFFFFLTGALSALGVFCRWRLPSSSIWPYFVSMGVLAAICLPWPLLMQYLWRDRFVAIIGEELAARNFGEFHSMAPLSALAGSLGLILPWTPLVVGAVWFSWRQESKKRALEVIWLMAWMFFSILPFFFMRSFERYMLAILPIQACLAALVLEQATDAQRKWMLRISAWLLLNIVGWLCLFVIWFELAFMAPGLGLLLVGWVFFESCRKARPLYVVGGGALALAICLGFVYPALGIHAIPADVTKSLGGLTARHFQTRQPAMLSMRLGYSVQQFNPDKLADSKGEIVFYQATERADLQAIAATYHLGIEELGCFKTLTSHKALIPFAAWPWKKPYWGPAFKSRSLESFKLDVCYARVYREVSSQMKGKP